MLSNLNCESLMILKLRQAVLGFQGIAFFILAKIGEGFVTSHYSWIKRLLVNTKLPIKNYSTMYIQCIKTVLHIPFMVTLFFRRTMKFLGFSFPTYNFFTSIFWIIWHCLNNRLPLKSPSLGKPCLWEMHSGTWGQCIVFPMFSLCWDNNEHSVQPLATPENLRQIIWYMVITSGGRSMTW